MRSKLPLKRYGEYRYPHAPSDQLRLSSLGYAICYREMGNAYLLFVKAAPLDS